MWVIENKHIELIPRDVWQLISKRLSQKDRSSARAASRFFYQRFTPEWDRYCQDRRRIRSIAADGDHSLLLTESCELLGCGHNEGGHLGLWQTNNQGSWIPFTDKTSIRALATAGPHNLLLTEMGELLGCGYNEYGQLGLGHNISQMNWVKMDPFPKHHGLSFEELLTQRQQVLSSVSLKTILRHCDVLFQQLLVKKDKAKQQAIFSEMKSSLLKQPTEPLPHPWDQEFEHLALTEFETFYQRLQAHCKLAPAEESSSLDLLTI